MKKLFLVILFYLFSQVSSLANERDIRLNQLFNELKANKSKVAFIIEQEIWALWSTHPTDEKLTARLEEGAQFVRDQNYLKAKDIFTEIINLDQSWAEAWNKRATVLYMLGEFQKSQDDIDQIISNNYSPIFNVFDNIDRITTGRPAAHYLLSLFLNTSFSIFFSYIT